MCVEKQMAKASAGSTHISFLERRGVQGGTPCESAGVQNPAKPVFAVK